MSETTRVSLQRADPASPAFITVDFVLVSGDSEIRFEIGPLNFLRDEGAQYRFTAEAIDYGNVDGEAVTLRLQRSTGIDVQPADVTAGVGGNAEFRVQAHGTNLEHRWQVDGPARARVTTALYGPLLRFERLEAADDGSTVQVLITGTNGAVTSRVARLTVTRRGPVVFEDTEFLDADWSLETLTVGRGGTASAGRRNTDGDPGAMRAVDIHVSEPDLNAPSAVYALQWQRLAVYDPRVQGAVLSVDYQEDLRRAAGSPEQSAALIARQGGQVYYAAAVGATETTWTRRTALSLSDQDFGPLGGAGPVRPIDFSATGTPIEFGFLRANNAGAGTGALSTTGHIDNWSVTVWR
jgi:hypothetical protein